MNLGVVTSVSPTSGSPPLSVYFAANATGGTPPYSFEWDFGDNTPPATTQDAIHVYAAGSYEVVLAVTDSTGLSVDSDPVAVTVSAAIPNATFTPLSGQVCAASAPAPLAELASGPENEAIPAGPALEQLPVGGYYDRCLGEYVGKSPTVPPFPGVTVVDHSMAGDISDGGNPIIPGDPVDVPAGAMILVATYWSLNPGVVAVSDNSGNMYTFVGQEIASDTNLQVFSAVAAVQNPALVVKVNNHATGPNSEPIAVAVVVLTGVTHGIDQAASFFIRGGGTSFSQVPGPGTSFANEPVVVFCMAEESHGVAPTSDGIAAPIDTNSEGDGGSTTTWSCVLNDTIGSSEAAYTGVFLGGTIYRTHVVFFLFLAQAYAGIAVL